MEDDDDFEGCASKQSQVRDAGDADARPCFSFIFQMFFFEARELWQHVPCGYMEPISEDEKGRKDGDVMRREICKKIHLENATLKNIQS